MTNAAIHPAAPHHLPPFITAPGETDYFYNGSVIFLIVLIFVLGSLYFRLHALPEHLAHDNANKIQFQLVGSLALLALFTHNNLFWVAALILAIVRLPDLATPLVDMADSLAKLASGRKRAALTDVEARPPDEQIVETIVPPAGSSVAARPQSSYSIVNGPTPASSGTAEGHGGSTVGSPVVPDADRKVPTEDGSSKLPRAV